MLPDKLSGKETVVPDNYLFVPDNVCDRPLIFRLGMRATYRIKNNMADQNHELVCGGLKCLEKF
jgi:hypothetical protein